MSIRLPQNPGLGGLDELTNAEELFIQNLAGLSYTEGDVLFQNSSDLTNLAIGTNGQVLTVNAGATAPEWTTLAGSGDVTGDSASVDKELVRFNSTTGKIIESPNADNSNVTATLSDGVDLTLYDAINDGNPAFSYGSSSTNRLVIIPTYDSGAQTLDFVEFTGVTAAAGADKGEFRFKPDGTLVLTIDDDGIEIKASGALNFGAVRILSDSSGTTTLENIDALDSATESTIEAAIDTLANLVSIQSLTVTLADAGADAILGWDDTASAYENLTQAEVLAVIGDSTDSAKGVVELATDAEMTTGTSTVLAITPANAKVELDKKSLIAGSSSIVTVGALDAGSITANFGNIDTGSGTITTTGAVATGALTATGDSKILLGDFTIGATSANDVQPALKIIGDADSDAGGDTDDTLTLKLTANATPTLATWDFTSTQSAGYTFDKNITFAANDILLGTGTGDKASIILNDSALADESWSGTTVKGTGGATIAVGDVCYLQTSDSRWELVDGILDGTDVGFKLELGICVLATSDGAATEMLVDGLIASAAFPTLTVGAPVYLDDTAGNLVVAQPSTTNFAIRVVGYGHTATVLRFDPSNDYVVHV